MAGRGQEMWNEDSQTWRECRIIFPEPQCSAVKCKKLIVLQSTFAAAAIIGIFSWPEISETLWFCRALFYTTLTLSTWAMISSFQQSHLLDELPTRRQGDSKAEFDVIRRLVPEKKCFRYLVTTLVMQFPAMLHSYAWVTLLLGLLLHVCSPFIRGDPWDDRYKVWSRPLRSLDRADVVLDCDILFGCSRFLLSCLVRNFADGALLSKSSKESE